MTKKIKKEETARFRRRVIDTARQMWIHTPDEEKDYHWFKNLFSDAEFFETAADNYLETGQSEVVK